MRDRRASALNPPNTTECAAPNRAQASIATAATANLEAHAIITDMNEVLGVSAGNAVEIDEAVRFRSASPAALTRAFEAAGLDRKLIAKRGASALLKPSVVERDGMTIMVDDDRLPLHPGEVTQMRRVRFRTLGCYPLTGAVESNAVTLPDIIQEMLLNRFSERQGRLIDFDEEGSMEVKKREGYF